jgi:hypothetical protein
LQHTGGHVMSTAVARHDHYESRESGNVRRAGLPARYVPDSLAAQPAPTLSVTPEN